MHDRYQPELQNLKLRSPMKSIVFFVLCLLAAPLYAKPSYPPAFKNARVETYRKIDSTELKLWIFGESDPKTPKPAIVFFFGGGWNGGTPAQFEDQARHFAKRGMIAITADYGTLPGHVESGEERFLIEWDRDTDRVCYDILAFSRPNHLLTRLGYPLVRRSQKRFGRDSAEAMFRAVNSASRLPEVCQTTG